MSERIRGNFCPKCRELLDMATSIDGTASLPKPGDVGVCFDCGNLYEFGEDGIIKTITPEKMQEIAKESWPTIEKILALIAERKVIQTYAPTRR